MPKFTVYEAQEVTKVQVWEYEVEADDNAAAIAMVQAGNGPDAIDAGTRGDFEYGESQWCAAEGTSSERDQQHEEAIDQAVMAL